MTDAPAPGPAAAGPAAARARPPVRWKAAWPAARWRAAWPAAVFLALAVLHTWPLASDPGRLSRHTDDEWLNAWAVSWIAHQLPRAPLDLADANIFHPTESALAFTEPLLVPGLMGAPLGWLGAPPMLLYNLLLLAGLTLTGWAMMRLVAAWTGDPWAGLLAGAVLTFSSAMLTRLPHLQILHFYALPLALLALDRLLRGGRARDAAWVGAWVLCAALTSGYLAIFVCLTLGAALAARAPEMASRRGVAALGKLAAAAAVTLAVLWALLRPWFEAQAARPLEGDAADIPTVLAAYLTTAGRLHYELWSEAFWGRAPRPLFPGAVAFALAGAALVLRGATPRGVRRMLLAVAATGLLLSFGPLTPVWEWAYELLPPIRTLRAPSRFGTLVVFAVAALAGLGLAALRRRLPPCRATAAAAGVLAVATLESVHGPLPYRPVEASPPVYRALAWLEPGPIVDLPLHYGTGFHRNARYLLASTAHWRPTVAGFGNSRPPGFDELARVVETFPSLLAVARLQSIGVRHAVVHLSDHPRRARLEADLAAAGARPDLVLAAEVGAERVFRIAAARIDAVRIDAVRIDATRIRAAPPAGAAGADAGAGDEVGAAAGDVAGVVARLADLPWTALAPVESGAEGSWLRGYAAGGAFALQGPGRFVAYVEGTTAGSYVNLRLPVPMRGRLIDALTGRDLGPLDVPAAAAPASGPGLAHVPLPPALRAVIVELRARELRARDPQARALPAAGAAGAPD